ncbi:MAG: TonB-dependent receptor [Fulvivirga sp.]
MKRSTTINIALLFLLINYHSFGQNERELNEIVIDGLYQTTLDHFLDEVETKHGIKFSYDREKFSEIEVNHRYFKQPLDIVLETLAKNNDLKYKQDALGKIHFLQGGGVIDTHTLIEYSGPSIRGDLTISGQIKDDKTGETLPFVAIQVKGQRIGTTSNVDGFFSVLNVPTDTSTIEFSYIGYERLEIKLNPKIKITGMVVEMASGATKLDEVVIAGTRESVMQVNEKMSAIKLTPSQLDKLPSLGEKDIFRSLQLMPGISAANENSSGLYIRGGTPDQVLVTYDGFTVYHVDHLFGFYSAFNSNAIKDVNLYKGSFESKYGGRVSGVAEITGKDGNQNDFNIGGDLSLLSANVFTEVPIGRKISTLFAVRKSYKGPLYNTIFDAFGPEEQEAPTQNANRPGFSSTSSTVSSFFYDINGKITYRPTSKDVLSMSLYNGKDDLDNSSEVPSFGAGFGSFSANTSDITQWGNKGVSLKWARQWSDKLYTNILGSNSSYFSNRDRTNSRTITPDVGESRTINTGLLEDNHIKDQSIKADVRYQLSNKHTLELGTHITKNDIDYSYSQNDTISIIDRKDEANIYAFYLQDQVWMFGQKLKINPGARVTYYDLTGETYIEPRISANYYLNNQITLKASIGRYNQFAKRVIREDVLQGSRDFWAMADGDKLPVLQSDQLIAGVSYEKNGFLFDMEGYVKKLTGLSEYSLRFTTDQGGINYEDSFYEGTGTTRGIDFMVQKTHGNYTGWVSYTLSKTKYNFPDFQETDFAATHDVTNEINFVNMYKFGPWDFSLTWIYATGRPYTEPTGGYSVSLLDGTSQDYVSVSGKNAVRFPDYHRMDASVSYSWKGKRGGTNSISTSFFNLYNRENIWYKEYQIEEDELIETNIKYLGFTPNISLTFKLR